jgi:hypothetical protein
MVTAFSAILLAAGKPGKKPYTPLSIKPGRQLVKGPAKEPSVSQKKLPGVRAGQGVK